MRDITYTRGARVDRFGRDTVEFYPAIHPSPWSGNLYGTFCIRRGRADFIGTVKPLSPGVGRGAWRAEAQGLRKDCRTRREAAYELLKRVREEERKEKKR